MTNWIANLPIFVAPALVCWAITFLELAGSRARRPLLRDSTLFIGVVAAGVVPILNIAIAAALLVKMIERYEFERRAD